MTVLIGDSLEQLRTLPDESVDCCVTSPPYYRLRKYTEDPRELGWEDTPEEFVGRLGDIFDEVRRVLRPQGTCWIVMGDTYAGSWGNQGNDEPAHRGDRRASRTGALPPGSEAKPKDLYGIPYMLAFELRRRGWWWRNLIPWAKPNPFPSSVKDRFTCSHEAVLVLSKSARYWSDLDAIREPATGRASGNGFKRESMEQRGGRGRDTQWDGAETRHPRDFWFVPVSSYPGAHYATFPEEVARRAILAGCPGRVCAHCDAPWARVVESTRTLDGEPADLPPMRRSDAKSNRSDQGVGHHRTGTRRVDLGLRPGCDHGGPTVGGVVLDPFLGSGTVAQVAQERGRRWIGIDLDPRNEALIHKRTRQQSLFTRPTEGTTERNPTT